jgi:CheY-like chemotaxis protein
VPRQRLGVRRAVSAPSGARYSKYVTAREEPKAQQASCAQERVLRAAADVDVALLDLMLPGVSRLEVARRARADPRTPALPIAFMSTIVDRRRSSED